MKSRWIWLVATLVAALLLQPFKPVLAQSAGLPQTIFGKFVHQPGDNQYEKQSQMERHGPPAYMMMAAPVQSAAPGFTGWQPTPRPPKPDISLDPIAADEPISPPGFPPLPDRLDLPVSSAYALSGNGGSGGGYGGGYGSGGAGGGGAPASGSAGQCGYVPPHPRNDGPHQHYLHFDPGAFIAPPHDQPVSHGYYKARTPESFSAQSKDAPDDSGMPRYHGAGAADFRALGKEPKLNDRSDTQAPEAPSPVVINQSTTQDLSLPEDEFNYQKPRNPNGAGSKALQNMGKRLLMPLNSMGSMAGVHF